MPEPADPSASRDPHGPSASREQHHPPGPRDQHGPLASRDPHGPPGPRDQHDPLALRDLPDPAGCGPDALPEDLLRAMEALASAAVLLVALDFDGTLAPTVDDPEDARALPPAREAIERLLMLPGTRVAVVSGRAIESLERVSRLPAEVLLVGSHGAEFRLDGRESGPELDGSERELLDRLTAALAAVAGRFPGVRIEEKPAGCGLHTRTARPEAAAAARELALRAVDDLNRDAGPAMAPASGQTADGQTAGGQAAGGPAAGAPAAGASAAGESGGPAAGESGGPAVGEPGGPAAGASGGPAAGESAVGGPAARGPATGEPGHPGPVSARYGKDILEFTVRAADKGSALRALREHTGASATLFVGDDVTDEDGFRALGPGDVGVKVGPGDTTARFRVKDPAEAAELLGRLVGFRERHAAPGR